MTNTDQAYRNCDPNHFEAWLARQRKLGLSIGYSKAKLDIPVKLVQRAEELGFSITLIAQRFLGPDLDSWIFASALAAGTKTIEIMPAVHPGIMDPRIAAKMGGPWSEARKLTRRP